MTDADEQADCDIAVVGMAGRFPGARGLEAFWENLRDGVTSISFLSDEELASAGVDPATLADPAYVKAAPLLEDADRFDAAFFGYVPREAAMIDPQQRVLLECAWEALEDAGYACASHAYPVGVYAGSSLNTYFLHTGLMHELKRDLVLTLSSSDKDFLATRIAYKLNLTGPAVAVQCACSTSLMAVHMACQALLDGECEMALAGGVAVKVPQLDAYFCQEDGIVSRDGHVRPFDASATGTVFGSGAGIVVLKRLSSARAAGDVIRAVIRGSAANNDGSAKASFTAPSVDKQAEVIVEALATAGVAPGLVSYVETHGTGTALGDPIEFAALTKAWGSEPRNASNCVIGSVKANVGHLEAASGVVGLIKTVLALEHEAIPPLAEWEEANPACEFSGSPFQVNTEVLPWPRGAVPRRAGITSLGVGGTNVHVVLEEAPLPEPGGPARPLQILPVSARTPSALAEARRRLAAHLRGSEDLPLADIAFTLKAGRKVFRARDFAVAADVDDAVRQLSASKPAAARAPVRATPVVFGLPADAGSHEQVAALAEDEPAFRQELERCRGLAGDRHGRPQELDTFAVQYALVKLWMRLGVGPAALIGDGAGAMVAACVRGSVSLDDALAQVGAGVDAPAWRLPPAGALRDQIDRHAVRFLVLGPGAGAARLLERHGIDASTAPCVPSLAETGAQGGQSGHLLRTLGGLWVAGVDVDWTAPYVNERRRRVRLPTYPFERQRHWWGDTVG